MMTARPLLMRGPEVGNLEAVVGELLDDDERDGGYGWRSGVCVGWPGAKSR